jgi:hypothetical protein
VYECYSNCSMFLGRGEVMTDRILVVFGDEILQLCNSHAECNKQNTYIYLLMEWLW